MITSSRYKNHQLITLYQVTSITKHLDPPRNMTSHYTDEQSSFTNCYLWNVKDYMAFKDIIWLLREDTDPGFLNIHRDETFTIFFKISRFIIEEKMM